MTALAPAVVIPPYGQRKGWRPAKQADFGDGGAYPECHIAQYPLDLGKKKVSYSEHFLYSADSPIVRPIPATLLLYKLIAKAMYDMTLLPSKAIAMADGSNPSLRTSCHWFIEQTWMTRLV